MFKFRTIGTVIKAAGLKQITIVFLCLFFACSLILTWLEPAMRGIDDALWFCFQVITTIGFGDVSAVTIPGRCVAVTLSLFSIFYLAVITGAVVSYCQEIMQMRANKSVARFIHQLEHLPELSPEQLQELSDKVKKL